MNINIISHTQNIELEFGDYVLALEVEVGEDWSGQYIERFVRVVDSAYYDLQGNSVAGLSTVPLSVQAVFNMKVDYELALIAQVHCAAVAS